jgi:thiamine pyrophosphokinase
MEKPASAAVIVADAPGADLDRFVQLMSDADLLIAADGGARHLLARALLPHVAVGDFDSLEPELLERLREQSVELHEYPVQKGETDLELALLLAVQRGATSIRVLAALGGRADQHLANLQLLAHPVLASIDVRLLENDWEIFAIRDAAELFGTPDDLISLLPMTDEVNGIVTDGLYYPLRNETLRLGPARGVSNVLVGARASVKIQSGILLCMHRKSQWTSY